MVLEAWSFTKKETFRRQAKNSINYGRHSSRDKICSGFCWWIPGYKRFDIQILPSSETKASIWRLYKNSAEVRLHTVGLSTFRKLWNQLLPFVIIGKPRLDVCWECQKNNSRIIRSVNLEEDEKSAVLKKQEEHLMKATLERSIYRSRCDEAKNAAQAFAITGLEKNPPNSRMMEFHYSFDFAQQIHYPSDPIQPGPIFSRHQENAVCLELWPKVCQNKSTI